MGVFPQLGIFNKNIKNTLINRSGNNLEVSKLLSWIRIASAANGGDLSDSDMGLVLESTPTNATFDATYGGVFDGQIRSGRLGTNFGGQSVYTEGVDRTFRPSPTVDSLTVENGSRGLSRKANFSIKCYTLDQVEKLSEFFLEPGYAVLVEYGWNVNESIQQRIKLSPCGIASFNNYNYVLDKRINSKGTYDGFMGYITGGGLQSGDGETYIIDVELTTLGEIPAYLQSSKNGIQLNNVIETGYKFDEDVEGDPIGRQLFKMMYNRLPSEKRTYKVKNLINGVDVNNKPWASPENFINMNTQFKETMTNVISNNTFKTREGREVKSPDGVEIMSPHSYIRMELVFEILNQYTRSLSSVKSSKCSDVISSYSYLINTVDTPISAHKNIFSTNPAILYVPNSNLPDFGLIQALSLESVSDSTGFLKLEKGKQLPSVNGCTFIETDLYAFPSTVKYNDIKTIKDTRKITAEPHQWGYLRNLFLNFEYFLEILDRTNYVAKDFYYEILNGISSAVNSIWNFEITEAPISIDDIKTPYDNKPVSNNYFKNSTKQSTISGEFMAPRDDKDEVIEPYKYSLKVSDFAFIGKVEDDYISNDVPSFHMKGLDTPFISSNLTMDIPGMMRNHILGKRSSLELQIEGQTPNMNTLFAKSHDPVMQILNTFKQEPTDSESNITESTPPTFSEKLTAGFELFMGNATIIPMIQEYDRVGSTDLGTTYRNAIENPKQMDRLLVVASWSDSTLLKKIELNEYDDNIKDPKIDPMLLPIEFTFEVHGLSGIKIGDVFKIIDIPKRFADGIFQVVESSHELSDMLWKTTIRAQMRNISK